MVAQLARLTRTPPSSQKFTSVYTYSMRYPANDSLGTVRPSRRQHWGNVLYASKIHEVPTGQGPCEMWQLHAFAKDQKRIPAQQSRFLCPFLGVSPHKLEGTTSEPWFRIWTQRKPICPNLSGLEVCSPQQGGLCWRLCFQNGPPFQKLTCCIWPMRSLHLASRSSVEKGSLGF